MFRPAWKPIAAAVVIGTPAYLYYSHIFKKNSTFDIAVKVKGLDGRTEMSTRTLPLLATSTIERRLMENAISNKHSRLGFPTWNYATASLASNDPIEDANAQQIIRRDDSDPFAPGDYLFFVVMDGHGGRETSQLLSRVLVKAVASELDLIANRGPTHPTGVLGRIPSVLQAPSQLAQVGMHSHSQRVSQAIEDAFSKLDTELLNAPLQILANNIDAESLKKRVTPDLSQHPLALPTMLPAISGSCALMALLDTARRDLYVACTGDSRAVAGVWEKTEDGKGRWRVDVLTEDQTGRNPKELRRLQSEHPVDEADYVVREGRILGGLEPSRAFGDARYKWPRHIQETLSQAFLVGNGQPLRPPPSLFKTPPYVTARPVVTHRKLSFHDSNDSSEPSLRFVVLATDGLWDELSSEEVVGLVGGHLVGLKGDIPKSELSTLVPTCEGTPSIEGKANKRQTTDGAWSFVDENISAHLIRNALGKGNNMDLRKKLSIPAPYSRRYRDDITVTVVWWEDGQEDNAKVMSITDKAKAKL